MTFKSVSVPASSRALCVRKFASVVAVLLLVTASAWTDEDGGRDEPAPKKSAQFSPFIGEVTTMKLNVRILPAVSKDSAVVAILKQGDEVRVLGAANKFYKISAPEGTFVWVYKANVRKEGDSYFIDSDGSPLRIDCRVNAAQVGVANKGDKLIVLKEYLGWYKVKPPENVRFYVAKRYVKKLREFTTGKVSDSPFDEPKARKALCDAKLQEADVLRNKQHDLLLQNKIKEVSFESVIKAYEEAALYADEPTVKRFAADNARRFKELQNLLIGLQTSVAVYEDQARKAQEIIDQMNKTAKKSYTFKGTLDTVGLLPDRPAGYKLIGDGRIKCFLRFSDADALKASRLYKREVGVIGNVVWDEKWADYPVVVVETIDEIPSLQSTTSN